MTSKVSLVIQTAFLGDAVLTTPLIAELAKRGPVDVVVTPAAAAVLANNPAIRTLIAYDKHGAGGGAGFMRTARRLRAANYDTAYLAQQSLRSGALAFASDARRRVGFATAAGRLFYTDRIPYRADVHHAQRLLDLAGVPAQDELRPSLFPGIAERAAVDRLLSLNDTGSEAPMIALAPGSVWATKRWPYFPDLASTLGHDARIVVIGSAEDQALAKEVARAGGKASINAAGELSLLGSAELIRRCRVIITNDSSPQHLAAAVGTPTITLFGPTVPQFGFGPLAPTSAAVGHETLTCRPCDSHGPKKCPLGHWRCMLELSPAQVAQRARDILSAT